MKVQYVVLEYCPDPFSSTGPKVAVVTKPIETAEEHGLRIYKARDWSENVTAKDADYIRSVLDELRIQPPGESDGAFVSLTKMRSGLLRTGARGSCEDSCLALMTGISVET